MVEVVREDDTGRVLASFWELPQVGEGWFVVTRRLWPGGLSKPKLIVRARA